MWHVPHFSFEQTLPSDDQFLRKVNFKVGHRNSMPISKSQFTSVLLDDRDSKLPQLTIIDFAW